jgi:heat-inducible transcriptional repressor
VINSEVLHLENKMSQFAAKRIESYFHWRLTGSDEPENLTNEEQATAQQFYNEIMLRHIVGYANFTDPEIYRTGFSKLLSYPEFNDTMALASSLSLFENAHSMRLLLKDCAAKKSLQFWIGNDLEPYISDTPECAVITHPYKVNNQTVGAIGLLGPTRLPYRHLFPLMRSFSDAISSCLTRNLYKFKISYRQPEPKLISHKATPLLEDHRSNND